MAQQSPLRRQNATRRENPFTDAAAIQPTDEVNTTDPPTLKTLLPQDHKLLSHSKSPPKPNPKKETNRPHPTASSDHHATTAAAHLRDLKKAIYRAGYDKGYAQARRDAEAVTDAHVEALLQMGRDLGWEEAEEFVRGEKGRARVRNQEVDDGCCGDGGLEGEGEVRVVHWFRCARKFAKGARAKVGRRGGKAAAAAAAQKDENENEK